MENSPPSLLSKRFRGFLPVVIDIESGGFNSRTDALLEVALVLLQMDDSGTLSIKDSMSKNIDPFPGAVVEKAALEFTGIDLFDPERKAEEEETKRAAKAKAKLQSLARLRRVYPPKTPCRACSRGTSFCYA